MIELISEALVLGIAGSLHCTGMCGPIAISLPFTQGSGTNKWLSAILYHLGRILTYTLLGIIFGTLGQGFSFLGIQQWVAILSGLILILSGLFPLLIRKIPWDPLQKFNSGIRKLFLNQANKKNFLAVFVMGSLNGLLPCGLIYLALLASITTGNFGSGGIYMFFFGLGTFPMLFGIALLGNIIGKKIRKIFNQWVPFILIITGVLIILRGLCLGIPYLSPYKSGLNFNKTLPSDSIPTKAKESCCHPK